MNFIKMTAAGLQCYMCKVPVMCRNGNFSKIKEHLQFVHKVSLSTVLRKNNHYRGGGGFCGSLQVVGQKIGNSIPSQLRPLKVFSLAASPVEL